MTALAEALLAAQRQAIPVLEKQYIAGTMEVSEFCDWLDAMDCRGSIDHGYLLAALNALKQFGGSVPAATKPESNPETEPATDAQMRYLAKLADERGTTAPDYKPTKAQASTIIEQLKAGTYNPDEWTVPF